MITLYPKPEFFASKHGRPANLAKRSPLKSDVPLTPQYIKAEARRLLAGGLPARVWYALDLLSVGGVLSAARLGMQARMLRHWSAYGVFERLQISPQEVAAFYRKFSLKDGDPALYVLGPLGLEIAAQRHEVLPPSGYQGYTTMRVMHDLMTNEVALRLAERFGSLFETVEWHGKYEITLADRAGNVMLEPDALLRFRKDGKDQVLLIEYHNEDKQTRAFEKVEKYERAHENGNWRSRWEVETFPPILAVFFDALVGSGYQNAIASRQQIHCLFYAKQLEYALEGKLETWYRLPGKARVNLFGQEEAKTDD